MTCRYIFDHLRFNIYDEHCTGRNQSEAPVTPSHLTLTEWNRLVQNIFQNGVLLCCVLCKNMIDWPADNDQICHVQKEILEEVVRELQKVKEEIIDGKF